MEIVMGLARLIPRTRHLDQKTLLQCRPVRNPDAQEENINGHLILRLPEATKSPSAWAWRRASAFELDEVGEFVWGHLDGKSTVSQLAQKLSAHTKMSRVESEAGLIAFLTMLGKRSLITLRQPQKP